MNYQTFTYDPVISRHNADGGLDSTFGKNGIQTTSFGGGTFFGYPSVIENDGKIIVCGIVSLKIHEDPVVIVMARYNPDGSPDSTFDGDGKLIFNQAADLIDGVPSINLQSNQKIILTVGHMIYRFIDNGQLDTTFSEDGKQTADVKIIKAAIQKNGNIIVAGGMSAPAGSPDKFGLRRFNPDGSADNTFGNKGIIRGNLSRGNTVYKSIALEKNGKVVAAGYTWNGEKFIFAVTRYNLNGSPDSTFSGDGTKTTAFGKSDDYGNSVAIQADGKIVIGGSTGNINHRDFAFARYTTNGEPDSTFSGDGKQEVTFGTAGDDYINAIAIQADGKIVAVGVSKNNAVLLRLNPNGEPDSTFTGDGRQTITSSGYTAARAIGIQKDGKIVVAGSFSPFVLARYTNNGYLDKTFGENGKVKGNSSVNALALQSDGKIIVAGDFSYLEDAHSFEVYRYTETGSIDSSFSKNGRVTIKSDVEDFVNAIAIESDGKILAGGTHASHSATYISEITRINLNGSIDGTFGTNGTQTTRISGYQDAVNGIAICNNNLYAAGTAVLAGNLGTVIKYLLDTNTAQPLINHAPAISSQITALATDRRSEAKTGALTFRILPNPAHSTLSINTTGLQRDKQSTLTVISASGVVVQTKQLNNRVALGSDSHPIAQTIQLNVSSLTSGMYIIKIICGDKVMYKQFVKM